MNFEAIFKVSIFSSVWCSKCWPWQTTGSDLSASHNCLWAGCSSPHFGQGNCACIQCEHIGFFLYIFINHLFCLHHLFSSQPFYTPLSISTHPLHFSPYVQLQTHYILFQICMHPLHFSLVYVDTLYTHLGVYVCTHYTQCM